LESSRRVNGGQSREAKSGKCGSTDEIPSPFIHSRDVWETLRMVLGVHNPGAHCSNTDRRLGACQPVCVG
jgi:hypothetical protein